MNHKLKTKGEKMRKKLSRFLLYCCLSILILSSFVSQAKALEIINAPATGADVNNTYSFTPTVNDVNGGLTFSIINQPTWATFDTLTGKLSGTPASIDIGVNSGVIISATDSIQTVSLPAFDLAVYEMVQDWVMVGEGINSDGPYSIAVDSDGNLYNGGYYGIEKRDPEGRLSWSFSGHSSTLAVDLDNNLYSLSSCYTSKYDSDGNLLWSKCVNLPGDDRYEKVAVDSAGNVYKAGLTITSSYPPYQAIATLTKLDANGNLLWAAEYNGGFWDRANDVTVDAAGNIYITGISSTQAPSDSEKYLILTAKYDADGNQLWAARDTVNPAYNPEGLGVAADATGNVYVAAREYAHSSGHPWILKYDANGNKLWAKEYLDSTGSGPFYDIQVGADGNLYVAGDDNGNFVVAMLDQDGVLQWKQIDDTPSDDIPISSFGMDGCGNIYMAGRTYINNWLSQYIKFSRVTSAPVAENGILTVGEDTVGGGTLIATNGSSCNPSLIYSIETNGNLGTAALLDQHTGAFTYTPNPDANGTDSFTFVANNFLGSNTATVAVTITPDNDEDNDGYDSVLSGGNDCNDNDPAIRPDAAEIPYNGVDENCNGMADDDDLDSDGYGIATDCKDNDSSINPGMPEVPYNGADENCSGMADDDDVDSDGYGIATDCNDNDSSINPGMPEVPYNGTDENCSGMADDDDVDLDGYLLANDCNDNDPAIRPDAAEISYNGVDENCNGMADDDDLDSDGYGIATDCKDNNPSINPGMPEIPYNGTDENCSGMADDDDVDLDGYLLANDCNDNDPNVNPSAQEVKHDGIDNDCMNNGIDLTIDVVSAVYNAITDRLDVQADSSYGAGANLEVSSYGAMTWNTNMQIWEYSLKPAGGDPVTITVVGQEGSVSAQTNQCQPQAEYCFDGIDNDCDGLIDSSDTQDCPAGTCDNDGVCDATESCGSCNDCDGKTSNRPDKQFCCGDGIQQTSEGDGLICDGNY